MWSVADGKAERAAPTLDSSRAIIFNVFLQHWTADILGAIVSVYVAAHEALHVPA